MTATAKKIHELDVDAIVLPLFQGEDDPVRPVLEGAAAAVDQVLDGAIGDMIALGDLTGTPGEIVAVYPRHVI